MEAFTLLGTLSEEQRGAVAAKFHHAVDEPSVREFMISITRDY